MSYREINVALLKGIAGHDAGAVMSRSKLRWRIIDLVRAQKNQQLRYRSSFKRPVF